MEVEVQGTAQDEIKSETNSLSDCPQSESNQDDGNEDNDGKLEQQPTNDEGYDGDMEGDGGLMPPPSSIP